MHLTLEIVKKYWGTKEAAIEFFEVQKQVLETSLYKVNSAHFGQLFGEPIRLAQVNNVSLSELTDNFLKEFKATLERQIQQQADNITKVKNL